MTNLLTPMAPNQDVTAAFVNTCIDNMRTAVYQTADVTVNNTATYQDSADLVLPLDFLASYVVESCLFYDTNATADIKIRFNFPIINAASLIAPWSSGTAITGTSNSINQNGVHNSFTFEFVCGGVSAGTVMSIRPVGYIETGTSSVPFTVGFAQNTATAVSTILKQGSWIAVSRVA
jgi:hypothetical protein